MTNHSEEWVEKTKGKEDICPVCGAKLKPTEKIELRGGKIYAEYACSKDYNHYQIWKELQQCACPKCNSPRFFATGETKMEKGILYAKYKCEDCKHDEWLETKKMFCKHCGGIVKEKIISIEELDKDRSKVTIKTYCDNPDCPGEEEKEEGK